MIKHGTTTKNLVRLSQTGGCLIQVAAIHVDQRSHTECAGDATRKSETASQGNHLGALAQRLVPLPGHQVDQDQAVARIHFERWCAKLPGHCQAEHRMVAGHAVFAQGVGKEGQDVVCSLDEQGFIGDLGLIERALS